MHYLHLELSTDTSKVFQKLLSVNRQKVVRADSVVTPLNLKSVTLWWESQD